MIGRIMLAIPLAVLWMMFTGQLSVAAFVIGLLISLAALSAAQIGGFTPRPRAALAQGAALVVFVATLLRDIVLSSVLVAIRVLSPDMRLKPAVIAVEVGKGEKADTVIAYSANAITLTPGELVIDVETVEDADRQSAPVMFVHTLDLDQTAPTAAAAQAKRHALLRRAVGEEDAS